MKLKIWNYRNYPISAPVEIEINEGITFVLGVNNIGKSNLLRFFYDFRTIFAYVSINNGTEKPSVQLINWHFPFDSILTRDTETNIIKFQVGVDNQYTTFTLTPGNPQDLHTTQFFLTVVHTGYDINTKEGQEFVLDLSKKFQDTFYIGANRANIQNTNGTSYDITIGQDFINTWIDWADGADTVKSKKMRLLIGELKELFNYNNFNIRVNGARSNLIITTDDGEFLLTEMGSGIAHFIVVLANVLIKQPYLVLIDEPEQNLHPKMQEVFLRALSSKTKFGILATSHSIGLARSVADKIYSLTSIDRKPRITAFGDHNSLTISQTISEMSYSQFVEIGGNNILLVEGRTDIKSFREILRKYNIENKFVIISFGGRQFMANDETKICDELAELKRLNANSVTAIFDSEKDSETDTLKSEFQTFIKVCEGLNFNVFPTDRHSTENYISQSAIDKVIGKNIQVLTPYENFSNRPINQTWGKEKNWLMFVNMTREDFSNTELDKFIVNILVPLAN
jgi:ABC-type cobalamin/Fe3+-siderophores transport system ATPase subunit